MSVLNGGGELKLEIGFLDGETIFFRRYAGRRKTLAETYIYDGTVPDDLKRLLSAIFPD